MSEALDEFRDRIRSGRALVGILGLGYVGLPMVRAFCRKGFRVLGFDIDDSKIRTLKAGGCYIRTVDGAEIAGFVHENRFDPTSDPARLPEADALVICVPTPLNENREPDLGPVRDTAETVSKQIRRGQLVILESTTYPGTTTEVVKPILEKSGLKAGADFHLAYSPEREDPGNPKFSMENVPKIVGGFDADSRELAVELYGRVTPKIVPVSSCEAAEAAKLLENIYRCVNIALVNELKVLFDRMGINVWEVIRAASTKPFGYHPFYPGPGLGGHCIPIDPYYLSWKARQYETPTRFIELAGEINAEMPRYVVSRLVDALNADGKPLLGSKILVLGIAYKKNVDDSRESPAFKVISLLQERGALVSYHDPFVPRVVPTRHYDLEMTSVELTDPVLRDADAVLIVTDHDAVDYPRVVKQAKLVVDSRNATAAVTEGRSKIVRA